MATEDIDPRTFWRAIGLRAVGTAVVTAQGADGPRGFLALSATHLSASPPLLMVSVDQKTSALATILAARHLAINYLNSTQVDLATSFGGKGDLKGAERFTIGKWTTLRTGAPILVGAAGALDCLLEDSIDRGSATIVIGRLVDFVGDNDAVPLISYKGTTVPL
jgi:flavin reductase (DIM6/NTAB) family NADH-FMN oxidoreductase RutF